MDWSFKMLTRISAEFENIDMAEIASKRIKDTINGVRRTGVIHNKTAERAKRLERGRHYTILPLAATTYNYFTATMENETTDDIIDEPYRNRKTILYIICEEDAVNNIKSVLNAMGGLNISA